MALHPMGFGRTRTILVANAQNKFVIVASEYFTKRVEAEVMATIT